MAKIYIKSNRIQRSWKWCRRLSAVTLRLGYFILGCIVAFALFFIVDGEKTFLYSLAPAMLLCIICKLISVLTAKQAAVLNAGVVGENATRQLIRHLPNAFTAISNVHIDFGGKTSELDMVVVGPTGVFVIETKNYTGCVTGRVEDTMWKRVKRTESGSSYASTFYSPVKQVSTHTYRLSKFLKKNKLYIWVQGAVYFSDASVLLKIDGNTKKVPVFRAESKASPKTNKLLCYIRSFPARKTLSPKTVDRIVRLLCD